jgi:putative addiction module killer protein
MKYTLQSTQTFNNWINNLKDPITISKISARLDRISNGNFGEYKSLSNNLFELKFTFGAGIRIYYTLRNNEIVLLLAGGDKSSQSRDINKAKTILTNLED